MELEAVLRSERDEAAERAIDSLCRYKFWMFGYWAARWVGVNAALRKVGAGEANPFSDIVQAARRLRHERGKKAAV